MFPCPCDFFPDKCLKFLSLKNAPKVMFGGIVSNCDLQASEKICQKLSIHPLYIHSFKIHPMYTKVYRQMVSRKRIHYISKSKFTQWSKIARENANSANLDRLPLRNFRLGWMRANANKELALITVIYIICSLFL